MWGRTWLGRSGHQQQVRTQVSPGKVKEFTAATYAFVGRYIWRSCQVIFYAPFQRPDCTPAHSCIAFILLARATYAITGCRLLVPSYQCIMRVSLDECKDMPCLLAPSMAFKNGPQAVRHMAFTFLLSIQGGKCNGSSPDSHHYSGCLQPSRSPGQELFPCNAGSQVWEAA